MYRVIKALLASTALLAATAFGQVDVPTAEAVMRQSGMWDQLAGMDAQVAAGFAQAAAAQSPQPSAAEMNRIGQVIAKAYAAPRLRSTAAQAMAATLDKQRLPALEQWYASPTGQAIARQEAAFSRSNAATNPQLLGRQGMAIYQASSPERQALIQALLKETRAAEALVEITLNVAVATQRGVMASRPDAPGVSMEELRAGIEQQRPVLQQAFAGYALASFALMYESVRDESLQRYVDHIKSPAGAHANAVGLVAFSRAMSTAAEEMGVGLMATKDKANI